ncbi:MAG TPA: aspartate 1-decarboxylase [Thermoanaerobaculia bacterium]|jgi:aspartate 1-decarboxylase
MRRLVRAIIRGASVTHGSALTVRIDPILLRAANILPLEEVEVVNHATGERVITFAEEAAERSGEVHVPGMRAGDVVSILSWGLLHDGQTLGHETSIVTVDRSNHALSVIASKP